MYIVVIGWLYVTLLVAATEPSVISGIISFSFYGALPCALFIWLGGRKRRRQRRAQQESLANQNLGDGDRSDTKPDQ